MNTHSLRNNFDKLDLHLLSERLRSVRARTEALCAPLEKEDYCIQGMLDVSPPKWHFVHTTGISGLRLEKDLSIWEAGWMRFDVWIFLSVNFAPVADLHHKDAQSAILNVTNHPAIAHPVTPEAPKRTRQCFACITWICQPGDTLVYEINDAPCSLLVKLA